MSKRFLAAKELRAFGLFEHQRIFPSPKSALEMRERERENYPASSSDELHVTLAAKNLVFLFKEEEKKTTSLKVITTASFRKRLPRI